MDNQHHGENELSTLPSPYEHSKLELISGAIVVKEAPLAAEILKSDAFNVIDFKKYLVSLEEKTGNSFANLKSFISTSPFFTEGTKHQCLKKLISLVFSKSNIDQWQHKFEDEIQHLNDNLSGHSEIDLVEYSFEISKKLLRPMILGIETGLPDDFEIRLYDFQKLVEPLLSVRRLVKLEEELIYLYASLDKALTQATQIPSNSLSGILNSNMSGNLSKEEKLMLLLVVYGAKTPLIQTLSNILLNTISELTTGSNTVVFSNSSFLSSLDEYINKSAALIYIHRMAIQDFVSGTFSVKKGDYVLIRTRSPVASTCKRSHALGFGLSTHYCSGALIARVVISLVVPRFFASFPNPTILAYEVDSTIHTAQSLIKLKVKM